MQVQWVDLGRHQGATQPLVCTHAAGALLSGPEGSPGQTDKASRAVGGRVGCRERGWFDMAAVPRRCHNGAGQRRSFPRRARRASNAAAAAAAG
eukprot:scaffold5747_cov36-Phaeocystis_antarctica.AAC.1